MIFCQFPVACVFVKFGRGGVNAPAGQGHFKTLHRRQSFGNRVLCSGDVEFLHSDPGIHFPGQRLPIPLCGLLRQIQKFVRLSSRLLHIPLCQPKFHKGPLQHHAVDPVVYHCVAIHFIADRE